MTGNDIVRFWSKVDRKGADDCWTWLAGCKGIDKHGGGGYGNFWLDGRTQSAHIVSFEMANGYRPKDGCVCHDCDNRRCVNPKHLYDGTPLSNARDRDSRGRGRNVIGEQHGCCKVTDEEVSEIRNANGPLREIGAIYHLSASQVCRTRNHHTRKRLTPQS